MRTVIWFVYFWSYLLFHLPTLYRGLKAQKVGNIAEADAIAKEHVSHWFNRLLALAGVEVTVTGQENLPNVPCVFVANHRSYYDIPLMMTQIMGPIPLVSKIEVLKFPIVNKWMELLHCLFLDRSDPRQGMPILYKTLNDKYKNGSTKGKATLFPWVRPRCGLTSMNLSGQCFSKVFVKAGQSSLSKSHSSMIKKNERKISMDRIKDLENTWFSRVWWRLGDSVHFPLRGN